MRSSSSVKQRNIQKYAKYDKLEADRLQFQIEENRLLSRIHQLEASLKSIEDLLKAVRKKWENCGREFLQFLLTE